MNNPKQTLVEFVQENARLGSLREQFSNFLIASRGDLPRDDTSCRNQVDTAMDLYFRINDESYTPDDAETRHAFLDYVRGNAALGSLREQFSNYVIAIQGDLPIDNSYCRTVVSKAMDTYFSLQ